MAILLHFYSLSFSLQGAPLQYEYTGLNHHHSSSSGGAHYYMNWGWGGTYNGWYFNENTTPGNNNYSSNRKDIVNIYPSIGE